MKTDKTNPWRPAAGLNAPPPPLLTQSLCLLLLIVAVSSPGCASKPKTAKVNPAKVNWSEQVGMYTYDQALSELGKPAVIGESDAGTTAEWVLRRNPRMSFGFGVGSFGPHTGVGVGTQVPVPNHGESLRLKFGKDGKLTEWMKVKY